MRPFLRVCCGGSIHALLQAGIQIRKGGFAFKPVLLKYNFSNVFFSAIVVIHKQKRLFFRFYDLDLQDCGKGNSGRLFSEWTFGSRQYASGKDDPPSYVK